MSRAVYRTIFAALSVAVAMLSAEAQAEVRQLPWPRSTALPAPAPQPAPPPALERAPSVATFKRSEASRTAGHSRCPSGQACVVCIAACDATPPVILQAMAPQPTHAIATASADNDTDGVSADAPRFARQEWAGIVCGWEGGCRGSGTAPRRSEVDVRVTIFQPSSSHYIDR